MPAASASRRPGFAAPRRNDLRGASHGGWNYGIVQGFSGIGYRVLLDSRRRIPTIAPLFRAGIAQLVERNLAKVEVASSSLVSRSNYFSLVVNDLQGFWYSKVWQFDQPRIYPHGWLPVRGACIEGGV